MKEAVKLACIVALSIVGCLTLLEIRGLVRDVRLSVRLADPVLGSLNTAAKQGAQAVTKLNAATDAETAKLQTTIDEARKDGRAGRAALDSFRQVLIDVHQQVIPGVTKTVTDADEAVLKLQPSLDNAAKATASAATLMSDPAIKDSIDNLAAATGHASAAVDHLEGITLAGEDTAKYYEKRLTTPQSFLKTLLEAVLQLGSQARVLFAK